MLILVTGATGRVGRCFTAGLLDDPRFSKARLRALDLICAPASHATILKKLINPAWRRERSIGDRRIIRYPG